jgi:uncharacterized protein
MALPLTNVHTHVFNSPCAPDRFLMILPVGIVRRFPGLIKNMIDSRKGRSVIHGLYNLFQWNDSKRSEVDKYTSFLDVGTESSQLEIFQRTFEVARRYDTHARIVGLTMNMDFMDSQPSKNQISFTTQLEQIKDIKRYYPANFFPFLGIDPRHKSGSGMVDFIRPYFETGVTDPATGKVYPFFAGLKLYPALGFFPFDQRLDELYRYAEEHEIPVMTHCTRVGSQYIGAQIEGLIPMDPPMIPVTQSDEIPRVKKAIADRISTYYEKGWIKNSNLGKNDLACDLFGHPDNYIPLLIKYPKLKICLAHMGGSNEIIQSNDGDLAEIRKVDPIDWFTLIKTMMGVYPNMYTDISYTLSDFGDKSGKVFQNVSAFLGQTDSWSRPFSERVLFGTDFFMTEQEKREPILYADTQKNLSPWFDLLARSNPQKFLKQPL